MDEFPSSVLNVWNLLPSQQPALLLQYADPDFAAELSVVPRKLHDVRPAPNSFIWAFFPFVRPNDPLRILEMSHT